MKSGLSEAVRNSSKGVGHGETACKRSLRDAETTPLHTLHTLHQLKKLKQPLRSRDVNDTRTTGNFLLPVLFLSLCATAFISCGEEGGKADRSVDSTAGISRQSTQPFDTGAVVAGDYEVQFDTLAEKNGKLKYEVSAVYPQVRGLKDRAAEGMYNKAVRDSVGSMVRDFVESVVSAEGVEVPDGAESSSSFELQSVVHTRDNRFLSVELGAYVYNAGAAHPNSFSRAINFNVQSGRFMALGDLFAPNAEYLKFIADYCMNELRANNVSDEEWLKQGAGEKAENYQTFFIEPNALVIHFDPYQVASYAAGPQQVEIPWAKLQGMLNR